MSLLNQFCFYKDIPDMFFYLIRYPLTLPIKVSDFCTIKVIDVKIHLNNDDSTVVPFFQLKR